VALKDGVARGYHSRSARPVAEVRHNGRPPPLRQDRWIVYVEGRPGGRSHHPRLAQELAEQSRRNRQRRRRA